jgi:carboxyl-terminal processing protease
VQTVLPLTRGGAVKLTTSRYFTPSGASIHGKGIVPDVLEDGPGDPPAELGSGKAGEAPLTERDADVRLALAVLKERAAAPRIVSAVSREFVP